MIVLRRIWRRLRWWTHPGPHAPAPVVPLRPWPQAVHAQPTWPETAPRPRKRRHAH